MTAIPKLGAIWVYLAASPLLGLTITLIAYLIAQMLYTKARFNPLANPVLIAVALLVALLEITHTPYSTYFEGAQFVHFLLGPATVALALPLYRQWPKLRRSALPLIGGLVAGSLTAIVSAVGVAALFGASHQTVASLAPKSATTPIAMAVASEIGGIPSLTAVLVISTVCSVPCSRARFSTRCGSWNRRCGASRSALRRMESVRPGRFRSARKWAHLPVWAWVSTASSPRSSCRC